MRVAALFAIRCRCDEVADGRLHTVKLETILAVFTRFLTSTVSEQGHDCHRANGTPNEMHTYRPCCMVILSPMP